MWGSGTWEKNQGWTKNSVGSEGKGCRCFPFPAAPLLGQKNRWEVRLPWGSDISAKLFPPPSLVFALLGSPGASLTPCSAAVNGTRAAPLAIPTGKTAFVRFAHSAQCSWGFFLMLLWKYTLETDEKPARPFTFLISTHFPALGRAEHLQNSLIMKPFAPTLMLHLFPFILLIPLPHISLIFFPPTQK